MQLIFNKPPKVGETFSLAIYTSSPGAARAEWYVDGNLVKRTECPDPPCHEQMYMRPGYEHSLLHIVATGDNERKELRFQINEEDPAPTVAMA